MLEQAYAYGITPKEASELTLAEMASFISARRKKELEDKKFYAQIGYSAGVVASSTFAKRRPRFEGMFNFPQTDGKPDLAKSKAEMVIWAETVNRLARKSKKGGK